MYTLRFPFQVDVGSELAFPNTSLERAFGACTVRLRKVDACRYAIEVWPFATEQAAVAFLPRVWIALAAVQLQRRLHVEATLELGDIAWACDPEVVARIFGLQGALHGFANGDRPAVFPSDNHIRFVTERTGTATVSTFAAVILDVLVDALSHTDPAAVVNAPGLRTAVDLYSMHMVHPGAEARFLVLVMALEALAQKTVKHPIALAVLDRWGKELDQQLNELPSDSEEHHALDSLRSEVVFRREMSIRSRVHRLILDTFRTADAADLARVAVRIYDTRSTLTHDGRLDPAELAQATTDAERVVRRLLMAKVLGRQDG